MDRRKPIAAGKPQEARKRKEPSAGSNPNSNPPQTRSNSRATKRVKFNDARNIRSQPSDAALDDGNLDLQKFINAREFEIRALEESMRKCKGANASRVFQQVPRAMRRRTASHNSKRVPKRLRERAKREMIEDNTPTVEARRRRPRTTRARIRSETAKRLEILAAKKQKARAEKSAGKPEDDILKPVKIQCRPPRPKIRRNTLNEPPKIKSKFRKRQLNKTWLPTHLWHAKRARMTEPSKPLWRFAVPLTPTEKCYRPTHRASGQKGGVIWDMSYMSTIGLCGLYEGAERVLKALGLTQAPLWGDRGQKWRAGLRTWSGVLSKERKLGRRDIGPATIIWNPEAPTEHAGEPSLKAGSRKPPRQLLIRTHPSCFLELFNELLKLVKMQSPQLHVEDLRFEIGSIELIGPGSTEALLGVLQPYYNNLEMEGCQARVFKSLAGVTNPSSLPKNAVLGFSVVDPRLAYPPKKVVAAPGSGSALLETLTKWPVEDRLKPFGLFDHGHRHKASQLPPQKIINRRKGAGIPGKEVATTEADPPISTILFTSRLDTDSQAQGTWTLLAPWKCILPIWYSLMHYPLSTGGNLRFGGLDEQRQVAFEHSSPWFPGDFPGTDAGLQWELELRERRKFAWDRRPKSKRIEWKSVDLGAGRKGEIGDGLACDYEYLFGLLGTTPPASLPSGEENPDQIEVDRPGESENDKPDKTAAPHPLKALKHITKTSFDGLALGSGPAGTLPPCSLATVALSFVGRGLATTCARIYRLPSRSLLSLQPSTQAEVPSTESPPSISPRALPPDLKEQWLRKWPLQSTNPNTLSARNKGRQGDDGAKKVSSAPPRMPPGADLATRTSLLATSLLTTQIPYPGPPANQTDVGGHPLCPGAEDLIGFVTSGSFSLSEGRATAIGSISAEKAIEAIRESGAREGRLCIVRNAGENVGWLARWEVV